MNAPREAETPPEVKPWVRRVVAGAEVAGAMEDASGNGWQGSFPAGAPGSGGWEAGNQARCPGLGRDSWVSDLGSRERGLAERERGRDERERRLGARERGLEPWERGVESQEWELEAREPGLGGRERGLAERERRLAEWERGRRSPGFSGRFSAHGVAEEACSPPAAMDRCRAACLWQASVETRRGGFSARLCRRDSARPPARRRSPGRRR
jgi:hypothetical protein